MPICLKDETFSESDLEMKLGQPPGEATRETWPHLFCGLEDTEQETEEKNVQRQTGYM